MTPTRHSYLTLKSTFPIPSPSKAPCPRLEQISSNLQIGHKVFDKSPNRERVDSIISNLLPCCPEIDDFIYFLSRNDIQHFVLNLPLGKMFDKSSKEKKRRRIPSSTIFFCM
uniref:Uncharacterized protein n=1 Tax=Solanum lycopersicum TaxID=4081 RepID=A0A3Q7IRI5_SOLLC